MQAAGATAAAGQPSSNQPAPDESGREIAALIARVEQADGVVFIRNGSEHSAPEAAATALRAEALMHQGACITAKL